MSSKYPELIFTADDDFDEKRLNAAFEILDQRLTALEPFSPSWQAAIDELRLFGLQRLNLAIEPVYNSLTEIAQLGQVFTAHSSTSATVGEGLLTLVLDEADAIRFAAAGYIGVQKAGDYNVYMAGALVGYNRDAGTLVLAIAETAGSGTFSDWVISAVPSPAVQRSRFDQLKATFDAYYAGLADQSKAQSDAYLAVVKAGIFGTAAPLMDGTATVGTATTTARSDHRHPTDTSRAKAGANTDITSLTGLTSLTCSGTGTFATVISTGAAQVASLLALNTSGDANVTLAKSASGKNNWLYGATVGKYRWGMNLGDATAEGGSNAGSDFALSRFSDASALLDTPLKISRSTGVMSLTARPSWASFTPWDNGNLDKNSIQSIVGVGNLYGTGNFVRSTISSLLGYWPLTNFSGDFSMGLRWDGNVRNYVSGAGDWASWDEHNFTPGGKMNNDGGATVVGYNSGDSRRPYISGSAYRALAIAETDYCAMGVRAVGTGTMPYISSQFSGDVVWSIRGNGGNTMLMYWNGSNIVVNVDNSGFALAMASDADLKKDIAPVTSEAAAYGLKALWPVEFEYTDKHDNDKFFPGRRLGFLADDLVESMPSMVRDGTPDDEGRSYKVLTPDAALQICALLIKANEDLTARVAALEAMNNG